MVGQGEVTDSFSALSRLFVEQPERFCTVEPVSQADIDLLLAREGLRLPPDFQEFLLRFGACHLWKDADANGVIQRAIEILPPQAWAQATAETSPDLLELAPSFRIVGYHAVQGWWLGFDAERQDLAFNVFTVDVFVEDWPFVSDDWDEWRSFTNWLEDRLSRQS